jgi:hypothetical protein
VISWFQNFAFKCNLHRYNAVRKFETEAGAWKHRVLYDDRVGQCKLNSVDP